MAFTLDLREPPQFSSTDLEDGSRVELETKQHSVDHHHHVGFILCILWWCNRDVEVSTFLDSSWASSWQHCLQKGSSRIRPNWPNRSHELHSRLLEKPSSLHASDDNSAPNAASCNTIQKHLLHRFDINSVTLYNSIRFCLACSPSNDHNTTRDSSFRFRTSVNQSSV